MADILLSNISQQCNNINNNETLDPSKYMFPVVEAERTNIEQQQIYSKNSVSVYTQTGENSFHLNIVFNKRDQLEKTICSMYAKFIQKRADSLKVFRRRPVVVNGVDVDLSLLITARTLSEYKGESIGQFVSSFAQDFEKERTTMKLYINSKARSVASAFLDDFK